MAPNKDHRLCQTFFRQGDVSRFTCSHTHVVCSGRGSLRLYGNLPLQLCGDEWGYRYITDRILLGIGWKFMRRNYHARFSSYSFPSYSSSILPIPEVSCSPFPDRHSLSDLGIASCPLIPRTAVFGIFFLCPSDPLSGTDSVFRHPWGRDATLPSFTAALPRSLQIPSV